MHSSLRIIEILILIVLPVIILYVRSNWSSRQVSINCTIIPILWYITYAPLHEFSHMLGCFAVGKEITNYRLFAHFWEGDFGFAFVEIQDGFSHNIPSFIILVFPYILDLIVVILGYYIFRKYSFKNSFVAGFLFMLLILRPFYDIVDNYIGIFYNRSDLVMASEIISYPITYTYGVFSISITLFVIYYVLKKYKGYPLEEQQQNLRPNPV